MAAIKHLEQLEKAYTFFNDSEYPFLKEFKQHAITKQPYNNLKIIHNTHITLATLCKIETLLYTGANITVTATQDLIRHDDAMELLLKSGIDFIEEDEIKDDYDIALDCGAGLHGKVNPRLGTVEFNQTGSTIYKSNSLSYPVISIDDSITKNIDNFYGTGDGFLRALQAFIADDLSGKNFILFGYGKVGKGIAYHLKRFSQNILVVEKEPQKLKDAISNGFKGIYYDDVVALSNALENTFCLVTATGISNLMSKFYEKSIFKNVKYFANMGSHDEFGKLFSDSEILFAKKPINFFLKEPIKFKFLDPSFYLHNRAAETLLLNKRKPGVYSYPIQEDLAVIGKWSKIHKISTSQIVEAKSDASPNILENLLRYLPCYVYWKDKYSKYMGCNHLFARAAGLASPNDIIGKTDFDLAWKETEAALFQASDREVLEGESKINFIETQYQADGATKTVLASKVPLFQENGEIKGVMGIYVDITAEKQAEQLRLEIANHEVEHLNFENKMHKQMLQQQEKFTKIATQVAHDIASPTVALSMVAEACAGELPEDMRQMLKDATTRINDVANNLLNQYRSHVTAVPVADEQQEAMLLSSSLLQMLSEKKLQYAGLQIQFNFVSQQKDRFAFIKAQPKAFKRMISNIINNAIDALDQQVGTVTLRFDVDHQLAKISIEDNGKGMSEAIINKIMNNITVTAGKANGHGIGMEQVRETLANNNGKMEIHSVLGQGSKITLIFPQIAKPDWIADKINLSGHNTILILDDDFAIHGAWDKRFSVDAPNIPIKHFTYGKELIDYVNKLSSRQKANIFLLTDYELLKQDLNGLTVVEKTGLKNVILVTSHYENEKVRAEAAKTGVKILPKILASEVPVMIDFNGNLV